MGSSESSSPVFDTSGQDQFKNLKSNNNHNKKVFMISQNEIKSSSKKFIKKQDY